MRRSARKSRVTPMSREVEECHAWLDVQQIPRIAFAGKTLSLQERIRLGRNMWLTGFYPESLNGNDPDIFPRKVLYEKATADADTN